MKNKIALLVLSFTLLIAACNPKNQDSQSASEAMQADSLSIKLNSPELKEVNAELLKDPTSAALYDKRAKIYLSLKQLNEAVYDANRAIRIDSANPAYYITLVDVYYGRNNTRKAKDLLEIIEKKFPTNVEALLKLGELYYVVRQYQKGIDYVNKALKIDENLAKAYYIKGSIYRESGDTAKAISSLETTIEQDNNYEDAYHDLGVLYGARKNAIALEYYKNAIKINPDNTATRYAHAKLLQDLGKTDEAIKEYEDIQNTTKNCEDCCYNLGAIYVEIKKDNRKAIDYFTKTLQLNPNYTAAYFARGYAYSKLNDKEAAKADFKMCLKLQPNHDEAAQALNGLR